MLLEAFIGYLSCLIGRHKWVYREDFNHRFGFERCTHCAKVRDI